MESLFVKPSKKKQFSKNSSLTSVESLKTPKIRRKSLGSVVPAPLTSKKSLDINRRKSFASVESAKKAKKRKLSQSSFNNISKNQDDQVQHTVKEPATSQKLLKRKVTNKETSFSAIKKIQSQQSTPLVLAPPKEEQTKSGSLVLAPKKSKKIETNQKFENPNNSEIKASEDLEIRFNIKHDDVKNAVQGVIKYASKNPHLQNQLFNEEIPLFLQINSFKIPKRKGAVKQVFRVPMKHSILPSDADICLIVPDVKGIKNDEHEKHLEYYENLLRSKDVTGIKKIMTFHEFRTEYDTFELKHRLVDLYDAFLVDGRISGKVVRKCGKIFYKKRKVPVAVKLQIRKLKEHIDEALKKVFINLNLKSDSHIVQVGHSKINTKDLVENVYSVVDFLDNHFPGKMDNIRSLNVYAHRGSSIPIYVSLKNPNEIEVPILQSKKPKAYKSFGGELTTQYNADVVVRPSGKVIVKRSKSRSAQNDQNSDNVMDAETEEKGHKHIDKNKQQNGDISKKVTKKRKISETEKGEQVTKENIAEQEKGPKGKKTKKQSNVPLEGEIKDPNARKSEVGKKNKTKVGNKSVDANAQEHFDKPAQAAKIKTKVVVTKVKTIEKDNGKKIKKKIKKKTLVAN